jgi:hypothetical protein
VSHSEDVLVVKAVHAMQARSNNQQLEAVNKKVRMQVQLPVVASCSCCHLQVLLKVKELAQEQVQERQQARALQALSAQADIDLANVSSTCISGHSCRLACGTTKIPFGISQLFLQPCKRPQ